MGYNKWNKIMKRQYNNNDNNERKDNSGNKRMCNTIMLKSDNKKILQEMIEIYGNIKKIEIITG